MTREEAIKQIRQWSLSKETREILEALAPELRESEDERIRQWLYDLIANNLETTICPFERENVLAYLEKQQEQKCHGCFDRDEVFMRGMKYAKEQMMKEAVEGEVMTNGFYPYEPRIVAPYPNCPYAFGDKVRIIILKDNEDESK